MRFFFAFSLLSLASFSLQLIRNLADAGPGALWRRVPLYLLVWLLAVVLCALHWLGFLLDELLFFGYRKIRVQRPIFILGVPRSGTTFLQRLLSEDPQLTTLSTWECLLAPSISERYLYRALGGVLRPLGRLLAPLQSKLLGEQDRIHSIRLDSPEEDFLLLWPLQGCLLAFLLCPRSAHYWKVGQFDRELPDWYRRGLMRFYHRCLQKHLYYHGRDKRMLSKNPSFTPMMASLHQQFGDARVIACCRTPLEAVPSQLSSLRPSLKLLGYSAMPQYLQSRIIDMLRHYYREIIEKVNADQALLVEMRKLNENLAERTRQIYSYAEVPLNQEALARLEDESRKARNYRSGHKYKADEFGLSASQLEAEFGPIWQELSALT